MPSAVDSGSQLARCARCKALEVAFTIRSEHLCRGCFSKYVGTKVVKRLEANRIRAAYNEPSTRLLLPISFGVSSVALLHILDQHIQKRSQQGRHEAYALHIVHVDWGSFGDNTQSDASIELLKQMYPAYTLLVLPIQECFGYGIQTDSALENMKGATNHQPKDDVQRLSYILESLESPSYRADVLNMIQRRLIDAYAARERFDFVLYGDTTTRLAEKTLAETAKGRGISIPFLNADASSGTSVPCVYPMRDLLRKEVQIYSEMVDQPSMSLVAKTDAAARPSSLKDYTIDGLMQEYIASVENNYPSIVANVVRTTAKLKLDKSSENRRLCNLCRSPDTSPSYAADTVSVESEASMRSQHRDTAYLKACCGCNRMLDVGPAHTSR